MSDAHSGERDGEGKVRAAIGEANNRTLNRTFDLLRNQRRRHVLETLYATPESVVTIDDIADSVLAHDPDATDRDHVLVALHHRTLPRLADDGVVDFDSATGTVRYRETELIDDLLVVLNE